jgi:hypothetical protein
MLIMQISRHSPESCAMFNEEARSVMVNIIKKKDEFLDKHGVKMVGSWTSIPTHTIYTVYDAPSMEAYLGFVQEPEMISWIKYHMVREQVVVSMEEASAGLGL